MTDYTTGVSPLFLAKGAIATDFLIHANVEFGVLQADGECMSIGICRITTTHLYDMSTSIPKRRACPVAGAKLHVSPNGRLLVFFPKTAMRPCTERIFFSKPLFPVPLAYYLPESVRTGLPGLQQDIIPSGLYPIRRSAEGYWIEF